MFINISHKYKSNNFDSRKKKISFIIIHYTETKNLSDAVKLLTTGKKRVSCHYLIDKNGEIYNLVDESLRAWHAGESQWKRSKDINSRSIGIEIVYPGEKTKAQYTKKQIESLIKLVKFLKKKYKILNQNILGHSDIAPTRKTDPGIYFPWETLAKHAVGIWVKTKNEKKKLNELEYQKFLGNLKKIGYPNINIFCKNNQNKKVIDSFHRHHLSKLVNKSPQRSSFLKSIELLNLKIVLD